MCQYLQAMRESFSRGRDGSDGREAGWRWKGYLFDLKIWHLAR